jgi:hypothetical protein
MDNNQPTPNINQQPTVPVSANVQQSAPATKRPWYSNPKLAIALAVSLVLMIAIVAFALIHKNSSPKLAGRDCQTLCVNSSDLLASRRAV